MARFSHPLSFALAAGLLALTSGGLRAAPAIEQTDVFVSGQNGYHTYRIPAVLQAKNGDLLAFCEGRKNGGGDAGDIDLLLKRSTDGGRTWSAQQVIWDDADNTCGNPCPVLDESTGTVWLGSRTISAVIGKRTLPPTPCAAPAPSGWPARPTTA